MGPGDGLGLVEGGRRLIQSYKIQIVWLGTRLAGVKWGQN
jgi:hypothetical protein